MFLYAAGAGIYIYKNITYFVSSVVFVDFLIKSSFQKILKTILNSSNSLRKSCLTLIICVRFAAIFNVEKVVVFTMTWSYVKTAMIVKYLRIASVRTNDCSVLKTSTLSLVNSICK